ncbi:MAG TPA: hypothetical protein VNN10_10500 [Dehalococcoidia bacterium]|nr:hypothetical protein [Dehalococcoidia bacterium]
MRLVLRTIVADNDDFERPPLRGLRKQFIDIQQIQHAAGRVWDAMDAKPDELSQSALGGHSGVLNVRGSTLNRIPDDLWQLLKPSLMTNDFGKSRGRAHDKVGQSYHPQQICAGRSVRRHVEGIVEVIVAEVEDNRTASGAQVSGQRLVVWPVQLRKYDAGVPRAVALLIEGDGETPRSESF